MPGGELTISPNDRSRAWPLKKRLVGRMPRRVSLASAKTRKVATKGGKILRNTSSADIGVIVSVKALTTRAPAGRSNTVAQLLGGKPGRSTGPHPTGVITLL